jgi:cytosol alanyl aminopeptidase
MSWTPPSQRTRQKQHKLRHKLLISLLLGAFVSVSAHAVEHPQTLSDYRLKPLATPHFQKISLTLDPDTDSYTGTTEIELSLKGTTASIEISGEDYTLLSAHIKSRPQSCDLQTKKLPLGKIALACERPLQAGNYVLTLSFKAPFNTRSVGLYKTQSQGQNYVFTQFEMSDARRAFPVFDEPAYKFPYQLEITAPAAAEVFSNTPEISGRTQGKWRVHTFQKTPPLPAYLLALAVGPFDKVPVTGLSVPGHVITPRGKGPMASYALTQTPRILHFLETYFGQDYPYAKLDQVAVPEFPYGGMENAGLITYREDLLLHDTDTPTRDQKKSTSNVIAHEIAHHWFGDLVTMAWWDDLWLNEAFASWMANKTLTALEPDFENALDLPQNYAMSQDAQLSTRPIRKPIRNEADIMDGLGLAYSKGSAILTMVENWIGPDAFQAGIQGYLQKHAHKNATAEDLWQALESSAQQPVSQVLSSYLNQSSFPLIAFQSTGKVLKVSQKRFVHLGVEAPAQTWTVPLVIKYGRGQEVKTLHRVLDQPSAEITLDFAPAWIYPDANAMGYYRWTVSDAQFQNLLTRTEQKLSPRERLALISASDDLLKSGDFSGHHWIQLMTLMLKDPEPRVVQQAWAYLDSATDRFVDDAHQEVWQNFMNRQALALLEQIGKVPRREEPVTYHHLRASLYEALAFPKAPDWLRLAAEQQVDDYLQGKYTGDAYLLDSYLRIAAYYGDAKRLADYQRAFENPASARQRLEVLSAMGFFNNASLQERSLNYILSDAVTASDIRYAVGGQQFQKHRQERFRTWFKSHYASLVSKMPPFAVPQLPAMLVSGCSETDRLQGDFFKPLLKDHPEYAMTLHKATEQVDNCLALKNRVAQDFNAYLKP